MAGFIYKLLIALGGQDFADNAFLGWGRLKRWLAGVDGRIVREYFARDGAKRLQIGCGMNIREGWLNTDWHPRSREVLHLDATKRYPFEDASLEAVFSEHMIEHVSFPDGLKMLGECFRVLEPGGRLRISTPDLAFLIDLYREDKNELQHEYIEWATEWFIPHAPEPVDTFVINNYVRDWGHLFIYDERVLRIALEKTGFTDIVRHEVGESEDPVFRGLENASRLPAGFLSLESVILEATKPASGAS